MYLMLSFFRHSKFCFRDIVGARPRLKKQAIFPWWCHVLWIQAPCNAVLLAHTKGGKESTGKEMEVLIKVSSCLPLRLRELLLPSGHR